MGREEWRRSLGLDPVTPVVLSVSRKSAAKRYDLIVEAMQRLRAVGRHPNAMLVLAGPDEDRRPSTRRGSAMSARWAIRRCMKPTRTPMPLR
jgi:glycosyltransferase involved in cell wall biosynthesis